MNLHCNFMYMLLCRIVRAPWSTGTPTVARTRSSARPRTTASTLTGSATGTLTVGMGQMSLKKFAELETIAGAVI